MTRYFLDNASDLQKKLLEVLGLVDENHLKAHRKQIFQKKVHLDTVKLYDTIGKLSKIPCWNSKWKHDLTERCKNLGLEPVIREQTLQDRKTIEFKPSFLEYVEESVTKARVLLGLQKSPARTHSKFLRTYPIDRLFGRLSDHFEEEKDNVCNKESTFFVKGEILPTQSTPLVLEDNGRKILDYYKVYRRETKDRTHFCEFYQLEYRKFTSGDKPLEELVGDFTVILSCFGIPPQRLQVRRTRYSYTSPSLQFFYKVDDGSMIEVCGAGLIRPEILDAYGLCLNKDRYCLAGALGLQRLYCISQDLKSISDCYRVIQ